MALYKAMKTRFLPTHAQDFLNSGWIYGLPSGQWAMGWGRGEWFEQAPINLPEEDQCTLYLPDFFLKETQPFYVSEFWSIETPRDVANILGSVLSPVDQEFWQQPVPSELQFKIEKVQAAIAASEVQKAVPVIYATRMQDVDAPFIHGRVLAMSELPTKLRAYGFWNLQKKAFGFMGATPETLFSLFENEVRTMALAGTLRKPASDAEKAGFLRDVKERHEHQLVIDEISKALRPFGDLETSSTEIIELPHLFHLQTHIKLKFKNQKANLKSVAELVQALHPTPAVGVAPRKKFQWLEQLEGDSPHLHFGAPFVIMAPELSENGLQAEALVAIRNVSWREIATGIEQRVGSGGGIVEQSVFEKEWQEFEAKRNSVIDLLKLK
jgi:menaquinone-specific isochorismate synthase